MNIEFKVIIGISAVLIGMTTYIPYFRDIFRGRTKPHAFSWFIWGSLQFAACLAQIVGGAGPGAWAVGATAILCLAVFILSLKYGEKRIVPFDWLCFILGIIGIVLWIITKDPLLMVIFASATDLLGFLPTFRKAYRKPYEETILTYVGSVTAFGLSLFALDTFSAVTSLNLIYLVAANGVFVVYVMVRRHLIGPNNQTSRRSVGRA